MATDKRYWPFLVPLRCYICERLDIVEFDYMCDIQLRVHIDDQLKSHFIDRGFCNYHFWKIATMTSPANAASIISILIENNVFKSDGCLICEHLKETENGILDDFIGDIINQNGPEPSEKRLCQPHFLLIMKHPNSRAHEYCAGAQRVHYEQLLKELKSYSGKTSSERITADGTEETS